ncbi:restriction endonuclease [Brevibacillus sp. RS1.1]|uniref:restriction endonuclease n=1 Tax=Brevibacillus sp. RS1.1 TaxID=2738982 RepID=UPI00156A9B85|nr:restriction endonuclease [Brevibacillus sp. RS1.1]NRR01974.1 restriction endonuclease [Brevibacillus sp. RS1.1]
MELNQHLYSDNYQSFDEWFQLIVNGEDVYPQIRIPYDEWLQEYLAKVKSKSIKEVKTLLRHLLFPINRMLDITEYQMYERLLLEKKLDSELMKLRDGMDSNEKYKRIEEGYNAWDGLTWVLELLPYSPYQAVIALEGYSYSKMGLPDDRIIGIDQCVKIIYEKFIYVDKSKQKLLKLKPVEFERLIERLYSSMGYKTHLTPATRDGGKDIIASIVRPDGEERVYIECKLYNTSELNTTHVKSFAYTVTNDKINRGVIFCTGYANGSLSNIDERITIMNFENIIVLLNSHLGSDWDERLEKIIKSSYLFEAIGQED